MTELERRVDGQLEDRELIDTDEERAYKAYKLQMAGHDLETIADAVGYADAQSARVSIRVYIQKAALELAQERRLEVLQLQTDRVNALISSQWPAAMAGDVKSAEFCLRAIGQLSRLYGLEDLHSKEGQSSKTIVIAGTSEQYASALKTLAEE